MEIMKAETINYKSYESIVLKAKDKEVYRADILENGKYITERIYNYYIRNNKQYTDKIEFKNYTMLVKSKDYKKKVTEVIKQYDARDIKKELLDNTNEMLDNIDGALNDVYDNFYVDLNESQKAELNRTIKTTIKKYISKLKVN